VTVITAWNPGLARPSEVENRLANQWLEETLSIHGYDYLPAWGQSRDGGHVEPSFAVFDLSPDEAVRLGRRFGQVAVLWAGVGQGMLVWY